MSDAVGGQLGGHQLGRVHDLGRLVVQDLSDEPARGRDRLRPTAKRANARHASMGSTPERPVTSTTRRTIGDGSRRYTAFTVAAARISTAMPALSINRNTLRSKISRSGCLAVIDPKVASS